MALKLKLTKAEHAALDPKLQAEYKAAGDEFVLDAEIEDTGELKRALDRERLEKKAEKERADKVAKELQDTKDATARSTGDIATLEKSWKDKEKTNNDAHKAEIEKRDNHLKKLLVEQVATALAAELGGDNAALLLPHITPRLTADMTGETPFTRVLDKDGKPSALNVEDLKKEISGDARFKAVIIASKASGGGANGQGRKPNGGVPEAGGAKKLKDMGDAERKEWFTRDPEGFNAAVAADKAALVDRPAVPRAI
jgi:hypothetical protein